MSAFYPFVIVGLVTGSIYGMTAVGLVLTYRTSGIFNFAHGATAAASAFVFYELRQQWGLPWPVAAILTVGGFGPAVGVVLERIAKGLEGALASAKIVATVGLLVAIQGLLIAVFGPNTRYFAPVFSQRVLRMGSVNVGVDQLITFAIASGITVALALFLGRTRTGIAMRGVVDDADLLDLVGDDPARVRRRAWMVGSALAALSGVLIAPTLGLDAVLIAMLVVQAFGAAAIGRFTDIPRTFVGGLVVGVSAALATKYVGQVRALAGFPASVPFLVLFVVLLLTRRGRLVELGRVVPARAAVGATVGVRVRVTMAIGFALVIALVPVFAGVHLTSFTNAAIFVLTFASLRLLVATSGQVSLCHAGFAAIGAATFSHFTADQGWPWLVALIAAGLVAVPVGGLLALPAIRLSGLYLALATFGFGILLQRFVYPTMLMFGSTGSLRATRPALLGIDFAGERAFFYLCAAITALGVGAITLLTRTRLGRLLRGLADSPTALASLGNDINQVRVLVFCVSAALAAVAGALFASFIGTVGQNSFDPFLSLTLVVVLALAGRGELSAPVVAAVVMVLFPSYVNNDTFSEWLPVLFGVSAVAAALGSSERMADRMRRAAERARVTKGASPVRYRLEQASVPS